MPIPLYLLHYKGNTDRRRYLESAIPSARFDVNWVTECDAGEFDIASVYTSDITQFRRMTDPIKEVLVGYVVGRDRMANVPWANCVELLRRKNMDIERFEQLARWLKPRKLSAPEVSLFLKHRLAWGRIENAADEWAIIAEDDIVLQQDSMAYFDELTSMLPSTFDFIDLVGGCNLLPRIGNRVVNRYFYEIEPPRDRTSCCAIMHKSLARRLVELHPPICLPLDWTLTWAFAVLHSHVYWLDPPVFGHGSEMKIYKSSIR